MFDIDQFRRETSRDAKKTLGQNFILDPRVLERIASVVKDPEDQVIVEIGPGLGTLTEALLARHPKKLIAIEMDERLVPLLEALKSKYSNFDYVLQDALTIDWATFLDGQQITLVSNLPYNISTELTVRFAYAHDRFNQLVLMFQKEVGDRIKSSISTKDYGRLSVLSQLMFDVKSRFHLPPSVFTPPPKVMSSVLSFMPRTVDVSSKHLAALQELLLHAFNHRRKQIQSSCKTVMPDIAERLSELGIKPTARPEELTVDQFVKLSSFLIQ